MLAGSNIVTTSIAAIKNKMSRFIFYTRTWINKRSFRNFSTKVLRSLLARQALRKSLPLPWSVRVCEAGKIQNKENHSISHMPYLLLIPVCDPSRRNRAQVSWHSTNELWVPVDAAWIYLTKALHRIRLS